MDGYETTRAIRRMPGFSATADRYPAPVAGSDHARDRLRSQPVYPAVSAAAWRP